MTAVASSSLSFPRGLAVDSNGRILVADSSNNAIRSVVSGAVSTLAGSSSGASGSANGLGTAATFNAPCDVAVSSSGKVFVADSSNYRIRVIDTTGTVSVLAGLGQGYADGLGSMARFGLVYGLTVNSNDEVLVADSGNCRIRKISQTGWSNAKKCRLLP